MGGVGGGGGGGEGRGHWLCKGGSLECRRVKEGV